MKNLIIYYSREGQNYVEGQIKTIHRGQSEKLVNIIKDHYDVDVFKVDTVVAYSEDYTECTKEAMSELKNNKRPLLKEYIKDISNYDSIIIAGPCWWGTYPMAIFSALDQLNLRDKKIYPIMTHEGSGLGNVIEDLSKYSEYVQNGLSIRGSQVENSKNKILDYMKGIL